MSEKKNSEAPPEGVVHDRRVVSRPLSWLDGEVRKGGSEAAKAVESENPNAPKPAPRNDYITQLKQMRRRHKSNERKSPNYMSDVKI